MSVNTANKREFYLIGRTNGGINVTYSHRARIICYDFNNMRIIALRSSMLWKNWRVHLRILMSRPQNWMNI